MDKEITIFTKPIGRYGRMDILMRQLMKAAGVTEKLKAADQIRWVGLANTCKAQAEDIILDELIYKRDCL